MPKAVVINFYRTVYFQEMHIGQLIQEQLKFYLKCFTLKMGYLFVRWQVQMYSSKI